jgi:hypothetical protein
MGLFSAPSPQMVQEPNLPTTPDQKPTLDPTGLKQWLAGTAGMINQAQTKKGQDAGFSLGQAVALGSGNRNASIYSGARKAF